MYDGTHSITFGPTNGAAGVNTWDDWFLIPVSRPSMSMPGAQNKFVEIPGMNGSYDISDYLTPEVTYTDRSGSFEFLIDNDHADWLTIYRNVAMYLHGQRLRMTLNDDPEWYYEGRFTVNEFKSDQKNSRITIDYRVFPFKISIYADFTENILWDRFCFERDQDWSLFWHIELSDNSKSFEIDSYGLKSEVIARLVSGSSVSATFNGTTTTLNSIGTVVSLGKNNRIGGKTLTLSGTGVVDVGWRKVSI